MAGQGHQTRVTTLGFIHPPEPRPFPKSDEFQSVEKLLREILDGKVDNKFYCGGRWP
jgi:hypothetical protein